MPSKPENVDQQIVDGSKYLVQSTKYSEAWWHGVGNNTIAGEDATKTASADYLNDTVSSGGTQSQANGIRFIAIIVINSIYLTKNTQFKRYIEPDLDLDENIGKEVQHLKYIPFSTSPPVGERLDLNSQMELVGHSIVRFICLSLKPMSMKRNKHD